MNRLVLYLKDNYELRKKKNSKYSLRSFARDLNLSSGRLVTIINKKEVPGEITLNKIFTYLNTPDDIRRPILQEVQQAKYQQKKHHFEKSLDSREISHMAHWEVWAVYTLMQRLDFDGTVDWLEQHSHLPRAIVLDGLRCLSEIELVQNIEGLYTRKVKNVTSGGGGVPSKSLRELHKQFIQKAVHSIDNREVHERDISGMTLCMEPEKMEEAKLLISEFRARLTNLISANTPQSELYQLSIQFFPLVNSSVSKETL